MIALKSLPWDRKYGVRFNNHALQKAMRALFDISCPICDWGMEIELIQLPPSLYSETRKIVEMLYREGARDLERPRRVNPKETGLIPATLFFTLNIIDTRSSAP